MTPQAINQAVELLIEARGDFRQLPGFPDACAPKSVEDGYAIQDAFAEAFGVERVGWKIACTSLDQQEMVGVDEPFSGRLFKPFVVDSPAEVDAGAFHMRGVESEFAFALGKDLPPRETPYSEAEVVDAVANLHPAFELVDTRIDNWLERGVYQLIADNAGNGGLVLGKAHPDWRGIDLVNLEVTLTFDGETIRKGTGEAVLGSPLIALTWIANHLSKRGIGLKKGEIVTTGTVTGFNEIEPGARARADFGPLGTVEVTFAP